MRACRFIRPLLLRTPPDPTSFRPRDLAELAYLGRHLGGLTETEILDMIRFWTMSISDFLDEYFENPVIKAYLAVSAIIGTARPDVPGLSLCAASSLHGRCRRECRRVGLRAGRHGRDHRRARRRPPRRRRRIRTNCAVERILVRDGRATGVVLDGGEEIAASRVVSNLDAKRTFLGCIEAKDLTEPFLKRIRAFKTRGSSGKVNIALDGAPRFPALPEGSPCLKGDLHFTDAIERMEMAYDDWKAGRWSRDPFLDVMMPTMIDPTMTPPGKHFMSVFVQYAPPRLDDGAGPRDWTDVDRDAFGDAVLNQIAAHSPTSATSSSTPRSAPPRARGRGRPD